MLCEVKATVAGSGNSVEVMVLSMIKMLGSEQ
jgi:hypothetical protein